MTHSEVQSAAGELGIALSQYDLANWVCKGAISAPCGGKRFASWPATVIEEIAATRALLDQGCGLPEIATLRNLLGPATRGVTSLPAALEELTRQGEAAYRHGVIWVIAALKVRLGICSGVSVTLEIDIDQDGYLRSCALDQDSRPDDACVFYLSSRDNLRVAVVAKGPAGDQETTAGKSTSMEAT